MKNRGQSLVGALVTATIMAIVSIAFMSMFKSQSKATRGIAARGGVIDLSHALDTLFGSPNCATNGVNNYSAGGSSPVSVATTAGPPASYSLVADTLKFANGVMAITKLPDPTISSLIHPITISDIQFEALGGNSAVQYPFKMTVTFENSTGIPPLPLIKFITVYTDTATPPNVIGACYTNSAGTTTEGIIATAPTAGSAPGVVQVYDLQTRALKCQFWPYTATWHGGITVTVADVNDDGVPDVITSPDSGGSYQVNAYSGADCAFLWTIAPACTVAAVSGCAVAAGVTTK